MKSQPLTADQDANLQAWRMLALEKMPYMARILFAFRVVNTPGLGTFACDPQMRLYIDFDAVTGKGPQWCGEALLHEASHIFAQHHLASNECGVNRKSPAHAHYWNIAADASINDDLRDAGCKSLEADGILPSAFGAQDYQTPHHYWSILKPKADQASQQQPQQGQGGQGQGDGDQQGQGGGSGQGDGDQQGQGGGSGDQQGPFQGCGSGSGGASAPCELDPNDDMGGQAPAASEVEVEQVRIATAAAVRDAVAKGRGTVPAGMKEIADGVLAPSKTPWQQVLASHINRSVASRSGAFDTDRSRRSRRKHNIEVRPGARVVYPGTYEPMPMIAVVRDTSGSMSGDDLAAVTREVEAIAKRIGVRGDQLTVTDVDAGVYETKGYKNAASIAEVSGRGGTDMSVGIEHLWNQRKNRPTVIVVLTDGYTPWPQHPGRIPVVAAIIPQHGGIDAAEQVASGVPDYIKTVVVEPSRD